jgi:hypothetical protein
VRSIDRLVALAEELLVLSFGEVSQDHQRIGGIFRRPRGPVTQLTSALLPASCPQHRLGRGRSKPVQVIRLNDRHLPWASPTASTRCTWPPWPAGCSGATARTRETGPPSTSRPSENRRGNGCVPSSTPVRTSPARPRSTPPAGQPWPDGHRRPTLDRCLIRCAAPGWHRPCVPGRAR